MADDLDILSPPYPIDDDNIIQFYERLKKLESWFNFYREASNNYKGKKDCIPKARAVPPLDIHKNMSLSRLSMIAGQMRSLRKGWDVLVCLYEDCWSSGKSQDGRHGLLHYGQAVLDCAYLSREMLEARQDTEEKACMANMLRQSGNLIIRLDVDPYRQPEDDENQQQEENDDPTDDAI